MAKGKIDLFPLNLSASDDFFEKSLEPEEIKNFKYIIYEPWYSGTTSKMGIIVSKIWPNSEAIIKAFNEEYEKLRKSGGLKEIYMKYNQPELLKNAEQGL